MKKALLSFVLVFTAVFVLLLNGCMDQQPKLEEIDSNRPDWLKDVRVQSEDVLWGIGVGDLSTVKASCELAKFSAQVDIIYQISYLDESRRFEFQSTNEPLKYDLIDQLNVYQERFYMFLELIAAGQVSFELSEFIKIERRTKTADGNIWYLLSLRKDDAKNIGAQIDEYVKSYFENGISDAETSIMNMRKGRAFN